MEDTQNGTRGTRVASYVEVELSNVLVLVPVPDRLMEAETAADWDLEYKQELVTHDPAQVIFVLIVKQTKL